MKSRSVARHVIHIGCVVGALTLWLGMGSAVAADPTEIRERITGLSDSLDAVELATIYQAIQQVDAPALRTDLKETLHARLDEVFEPLPNPSSHAVGAVGGLANPFGETEERLGSEEDHTFMWAQIDTLRLGPDATADDLRRRDELLARIVQIPDPQVRYALLDRLEERERASATTIATGFGSQ